METKIIFRKASEIDPSEAKGAYEKLLDSIKNTEVTQVSKLSLYMSASDIRRWYVTHPGKIAAQIVKDFDLFGYSYLHVEYQFDPKTVKLLGSKTTYEK